MSRGAGAKSSLVYDTGMLIAGEANAIEAWSRHKFAMRDDRSVLVPVPVLAQCWRGSPSQAVLSRMLRGCSIVDMTEDLGRQAGVLCEVAGTCDVVDATVVVLAMRANAVIITSDPRDIGKLVDAARPRVRPEIVTV